MQEEDLKKTIEKLRQELNEIKRQPNRALHIDVEDDDDDSEDDDEEAINGKNALCTYFI